MTAWTRSGASPSPGPVALGHGAPIPSGMAPEPRASRAAYAVEQRMRESETGGWRPSSLVSRMRSPD